MFTLNQTQAELERSLNLRDARQKRLISHINKYAECLPLAAPSQRGGTG